MLPGIFTWSIVESRNHGLWMLKEGKYLYIKTIISDLQNRTMLSEPQKTFSVDIIMIANLDSDTGLSMKRCPGRKYGCGPSRVQEKFGQILPQILMDNILNFKLVGCSVNTLAVAQIPLVSLDFLPTQAIAGKKFGFPLRKLVE